MPQIPADSTERTPVRETPAINCGVAPFALPLMASWSAPPLLTEKIALPATRKTSTAARRNVTLPLMATLAQAFDEVSVGLSRSGRTGLKVTLPSDETLVRVVLTSNVNE